MNTESSSRPSRVPAHFEMARYHPFDSDRQTTQNRSSRPGMNPRTGRLFRQNSRLRFQHPLPPLLHHIPTADFYAQVSERLDNARVPMKIAPYKTPPSRHPAKRPPA